MCWYEAAKQYQGPRASIPLAEDGPWIQEAGPFLRISPLTFFHFDGTSVLVLSTSNSSFNQNTTAACARMSDFCCSDFRFCDIDCLLCIFCWPTWTQLAGTDGILTFHLNKYKEIILCYFPVLSTLMVCDSYYYLAFHQLQGFNPCPPSFIQHKNSAGQKWNWDSYVQLLWFLVRRRHGIYCSLYVLFVLFGVQFYPPQAGDKADCFWPLYISIPCLQINWIQKTFTCFLAFCQEQ